MFVSHVKARHCSCSTRQREYHAWPCNVAINQWEETGNAQYCASNEFTRDWRCTGKHLTIIREGATQHPRLTAYLPHCMLALRSRYEGHASFLSEETGHLLSPPPYILLSRVIRFLAKAHALFESLEFHHGRRRDPTSIGLSLKGFTRVPTRKFISVGYPAQLRPRDFIALYHQGPSPLATGRIFYSARTNKSNTNARSRYHTGLVSQVPTTRPFRGLDRGGTSLVLFRRHTNQLGVALPVISMSRPKPPSTVRWLWPHLLTLLYD